MARWCLFLGVLMMGVGAFDGVQAREVRVGVFDYPPAIFRDSDGEVKGFFAELLLNAAAQEGWEIRCVHGSWSDGIERLRAGEVDLLTSVAYTEERAAFMDFGREHLLTVWGEVFVPEKSSIDTLFELRGKRIGIMRGDHNARVFRNHVQSFEIGCDYDEYDGFTDILKAIQRGEIDAGVVNSVPGAGLRLIR